MTKRLLAKSDEIFSDKTNCQVFVSFNMYYCPSMNDYMLQLIVYDNSYLQRYKARGCYFLEEELGPATRYCTPFAKLPFYKLLSPNQRERLKVTAESERGWSEDDYKRNTELTFIEQDWNKYIKFTKRLHSLLVRSGFTVVRHRPISDFKYWENIDFELPQSNWLDRLIGWFNRK